jgi:hypothetical protein
MTSVPVPALTITERYTLAGVLLYRHARSQEEPSAVEAFAQFPTDTKSGFYVFAADNVNGSAYYGHGRNKERYQANEPIIAWRNSPPPAVQEIACAAVFGRERGHELFICIRKEHKA